MILVAGGTGRLGSLLVAGLVSRGLEVRVLTRDPARARHLVGDGVQLAVGDVRRAASLEPALADVTVVVSAVQGFAGPGRVTPATVDDAGNGHLIDAATAAGADVVLMSVVGAAADSPLELFRAKYAAEQHLRASPVGWTIVRSTAFIELWAQIMTKPIVFGRGDNPINFVSVTDVAAVVDAAVVDPARRGRVLEVGGPQDLTFNELMALLQEVRGTHARVRHVPRALLRLLAPMARPARAALAMDTIDLTFAGAGAPTAEYPMTDARTALVRGQGLPAGS